jgi:predicted outer membrane lipoprotein
MVRKPLIRRFAPPSPKGEGVGLSCAFGLVLVLMEDWARQREQSNE